MIRTDRTPDSTALAPVQDHLSSSRLAGLDGLRALAVLLVLAFHLTPGAFIGGYLGVDVFFVISGFLITSLLLTEHRTTGRIHLGNFWRRRARRLLPALAALVLVSCAVALAVGGDPLLGLARQVIGAATFSSNWLFIADGASYFTDTAPELFRNIWSLAVEEQFYLLWPLLLLLLLLVPSRRIRFWVLIALAVASALAMALLYVPGEDPTRVYFGTDTHSFGLALGAALAIVAEHWPLHRLAWSRWARFAAPALGTLALAALVTIAILLAVDSPLAYRGGMPLVALLTAVTIAGAIVPGSWLGAVLDGQPLKWIGERSYGLYLWHWPVLVLFSAAIPANGTAIANDWTVTAATAAISFAAAALSYRFVETPIRRDGFRATLRRLVLPWRFGKRAVWAAVTAILLIAGTGTATAVALRSDPGKSSLEIQLAEAQARVTRAEEARQEAMRDEAAAEDAPAVIPSGEEITAIGDSVMLAAAPQLQEAFPGISIDATVSRQMMSAPETISSYLAQDALRDTLILGLGTNGPISVDTLYEIKDMVGPKTNIVLVNAQAPKGWIPEVNATLEAFAQQHRSVELANWHGAIQPQLHELNRDKVHPGGPISGGIYVSTVTAALQRLAELPPLLDANDYKWLLRPE